MRDVESETVRKQIPTDTELNELIAFCQSLIDEHLEGWVFVVNRRIVKVNGRCSYVKKTIEMSLRLLMSGNHDAIINNVTHEIAHALAPKDGHGHIWRYHHKRLGGTGERCTTYEGVDYTTGVAKYKLTCDEDHDIGVRRDKRLPIHRYHCVRCKKEGLRGRLKRVNIETGEVDYGATGIDRFIHIPKRRKRR